MDRIVTVRFAEKRSRGRLEHLIDQESCHASRVSRCCAILRLCSAIALFRSIRA
jgi:hypothetical protein